MLHLFLKIFIFVHSIILLNNKPFLIAIDIHDGLIYRIFFV